MYICSQIIIKQKDMNVQELRIGNFVNFGLLNIIKVEKINPKTLFAKASNSLSGKDEFHDMISFQGDTASGNSRIGAFLPIQLTKELLLKCGFTDLKDNSWGEFIDMWVDKKDFVNVLMKNELFIGKDSKDGLYYFLVERTGNGEYMYFESISAPMQYLHTLQNYYVTFKGEELEINL